jgi:predicted SprT family Zn-dependent metalloprotease
MLSPFGLEQVRRRTFEAVSRALVLETWPEVPVGWNRRLRRAGRAVITAPGMRFQGARIELSPAYFEVYPEDLEGILVHEAVHVGLAILGLPFGHGTVFRDACASAGGLVHSRAMPGPVFRYRCPSCAQVLERRRRAAESRWCARCVDRAALAGREPFAADRALILVGIGFRGPEQKVS